MGGIALNVRKTWTITFWAGCMIFVWGGEVLAAILSQEVPSGLLQDKCLLPGHC